MKKYLLMLATAVVALGFASCSNEKEDDEIFTSEKNEIKFNITVSDLDGANDVNGGVSTKAAKSGWVTGDKLNIWFDGNEYEHRALADLILTYDGAKWVAGSLNNGVSLNPNGTMVVLYEGYNDWENSYRHSSTYQYTKFYKEIGVNVYAVPLTYKNRYTIAYTFSGSVLSANINSWESITKLQVVVSGLAPSEANDYALSINGVANPGCVCIGESGGLNTSGNSVGGKSLGIANADGVAFYFGSSYKFYYANDYTFTLYSISDNSSKTYSVTGKTVSPGSGIVNIKIAASKFE